MTRRTRFVLCLFTATLAMGVLTHLAFYTGWPPVFSALPVAKDVFEKRPR